MPCHYLITYCLGIRTRNTTGIIMDSKNAKPVIVVENDQLNPMFTSSLNPNSLSTRSVPTVARVPHRSSRSCASTISLSRMLGVLLALRLLAPPGTLPGFEDLGERDDRCDWMLIGFEAVLLEGLLCLVAEDVILLWLREDVEHDVGVGMEVDAVPAGVVALLLLLLGLSLTLFEFPNQRLRRVLDESDGEASLSSLMVPVVLGCFSFSSAWVKLDVGDSEWSSVLDVDISTSSASRYHFLRRV